MHGCAGKNATKARLRSIRKPNGKVVQAKLLSGYEAKPLVEAVVEALNAKSGEALEAALSRFYAKAESAGVGSVFVPDGLVTHSQSQCLAELWKVLQGTRLFKVHLKCKKPRQG